MNYHIMTLFPDMIDMAAHTSIMGRAIANGSINLNIYNIRDYTHNKNNIYIRAATTFKR